MMWAWRFAGALALALAAPLGAQAAHGNFGGGDGSWVSPLRVEDAADLDAVRLCMRCSYRLMGDIDLTEYLAPGNPGHHGGAGWLPIGEKEQRFIGDFDGAGHKITGLWIQREGMDGVGLFGFTRDASIANLGVQLAPGGVRGRDFVGALTGNDDRSSIFHCHAAGSVSGHVYVGGLVGVQFDGVITGSHATGHVTGGSDAGGLVGHHAGGSIADSYATGNVTSYYAAGGLVGEQTNRRSLTGSRIAGSYATGNVTGYLEDAGGLVGRQVTGSITESYATGSVTGEARVGGLVGDNDGRITSSYATGSVRLASGVELRDGASLAGYLEHAGGRVETQTITAHPGAGGLVGSRHGRSGNIFSSFFDTQGTGQTQGVGDGNGGAGLTGLTTAQMQTQAAFAQAGWNFTRVWVMPPGGGYPRLAWQMRR